MNCPCVVEAKKKKLLALLQQRSLENTKKVGTTENMVLAMTDGYEALLYLPGGIETGSKGLIGSFFTANFTLKSTMKHV